jgi:hypothetical protein
MIRSSSVGCAIVSCNREPEVARHEDQIVEPRIHRTADSFSTASSAKPAMPAPDPNPPRARSRAPTGRCRSSSGTGNRSCRRDRRDAHLGIGAVDRLVRHRPLGVREELVLAQERTGRSSRTGPPRRPVRPRWREEELHLLFDGDLEGIDRGWGCARRRPAPPRWGRADRLPLRGPVRPGLGNRVAGHGHHLLRGDQAPLAAKPQVPPTRTRIPNPDVTLSETPVTCRSRVEMPWFRFVLIRMSA